jgi:hypothetical protein
MLHRVVRRVRCSPRVLAMTLMWLLHHSVAASEVHNCEGITGVFLAVGELRDGEFQPRPVVYLDRRGAANDGRHHFQYTFNSKRGVAEVVMFNAKGEQLFDTTSDAHACKGGVLVREVEMSGGSEGCLREGMSRSTLTISSSGALVFTTEEHFKYGFWCFKSPTLIRRTAEFLPYPAEVK